MILAVLLVVAAAATPRLDSQVTTQARPSRGALSLMSAGRTNAAGAAAWIRVLQLIGDSRFQAEGMPYLDEWLDVTTQLEPRMANAYYLGTVLLLTDRQRSSKMDELLARAEALYPTEFRFPMMRGMAAYFGRFDNAAAASHFDRAANHPLAPAFLAGLAEKARTHAATCGELLAETKSLSQEGLDAMGALESQRGRVFESCVKRTVEQAIASFRSNTNRVPTLEDLVRDGYLRELPPAPRGRCWVIEGPQALLRECP